jgi:transcriptional regulator with XRE-family HTH domain
MQSFNKEEFSRLLNLAKGSRSINNFALKSGVTAAHISRLLRGIVNNPPTPQTIRKISNHAKNNVSYEELMKAAGHSSNNIINPISINDREQLSKWNKVIEMFECNDLRPEDVLLLETFIKSIKE